MYELSLTPIISLFMIFFSQILEKLIFKYFIKSSLIQVNDFFNKSYMLLKSVLKRMT